MSNALVTLPPNVVARGIDAAQWNTLCNSLYPGAKPDSVLSVWDYCKARILDPMKKPCHIVPIKVKSGDEWVWRDVVMPGIYEYRTTAMRTGMYLGHDEPEYGPDKEFAGVTAPEWCAFKVWRWNQYANDKTPFSVRVYFREVCAITDVWENKVKTDKKKANDRWSKAPIQMLTKCAEAAALRAAFPDEFGGTYTEEEMRGQVFDTMPTSTIIDNATGEVIEPQTKPTRGKPEAASPDATSNVKLATPAQISLIRKKLEAKAVTEAEFFKQYEGSATTLEQLPFDHVNDCLTWINTL